MHHDCPPQHAAGPVPRLDQRWCVPPPGGEGEGEAGHPVRVGGHVAQVANLAVGRVGAAVHVLLFGGKSVEFECVSNIYQG